MELITFLSSILVLYFVWTMWRKVTLDACRDNLFDLREEVRDYFLKKGGLAHPLYKDLRDMLNTHIRSTEEYNLLTIWFITRNVRNLADAKPLPHLRQYESGEYSDIVDSTCVMVVVHLAVYLVQSSFVLFLPALLYSVITKPLDFSKAGVRVLEKVLKPDQLAGLSLTIGRKDPSSIELA